MHIPVPQSRNQPWRGFWSKTSRGFFLRVFFWWEFREGRRTVCPRYPLAVGRTAGIPAPIRVEWRRRGGDDASCRPSRTGPYVRCCPGGSVRRNASQLYPRKFWDLLMVVPKGWGLEGETWVCIRKGAQVRCFCNWGGGQKVFFSEVACPPPCANFLFFLLHSLISVFFWRTFS